MSVERNLPLVRERKQAILKGDPDRVAEQKKLGKLTSRERIGLLFDEASFVELDTLAGRNGESGVVTGYGLIEGRPAYVYAQDFTVMGGAVGAEQAKKILKVMDMARKTGAPVVSMFDSMGARLKEGVDAVNAYAQIAAKTAALSGVVPQIALVMGQCAASAAMIAALHDFVIVAGDDRLFMNGPQVVSANTGVQVDAKALGGPEACLKNGSAHLVANEDNEAIAYARKLVALLPANNLDEAPVELTAADDPNRPIPEFDALSEIGDLRAVLAPIADVGSVVELSKDFAPDMITAIAAVDGRTVGFVGAQGLLSVNGCVKAARFVRTMDAFNVPVVTLVNCAGFEIASACAQGELARACAKLLSALGEATCARVALVAGDAVAAGYMVLASREAADMVYAWPGSVIAPLAAPAAVQVFMRERLKGASDPQAVRAQLEQEYQDEYADGLSAAKLGYVDDVIEPSATRQMLASALEMLASKREEHLPKKHGNLPL